MEKKQLLLSNLIFLGIFLAACTATSPEPAEEFAPPLSFEFPDSDLPLAEPGPYGYSMKEITYYDEERNGRRILINLFFPSIDSEPDLRGAPFPLFIGNYYHTFDAHLASYGFIAVGLDATNDMWDEIIHQPLDLIFVLNQLADDPPEFLTGLIDTENVGVAGYSGSGRVTTVLSGAQINPMYYLNFCKNQEGSGPENGEDEPRWICESQEPWDDLLKEAGLSLADEEIGLVEPVTDDRIIATMPMSTTGEWLFGPRGLAVADKPILFTAGTQESYIYEDEYKMFQEYGSADKIFVSFVGRTHNMILQEVPYDQLKHLAIAFFSYHLKGEADFGYYFSEEYISRTEGLAWGWYEE